MKLRLIIVVLCILSSNGLYAQDQIKSSVVKIFSVYSTYNYYDPWQMRGQRESTGSGCIIEGNRILTNAHVVSDHTFLQVKRAGTAQKYIAYVEKVAHDCDLAILRVKDETFFHGSVPIKIGSLPEVRDKVAVYGFPQGGDELSITEGVVSRIEHRHYSHSSSYLLTCQIDAAINSGNSGGPVIKDNTIVGVAFQALSTGANIGYMVPGTIIRHFLQDIKDGKYHGIPDLGIEIQTIENPDIRKRYQMKEKETGVLIRRVNVGSSAYGMLKVDDILYSIDNVNIENDGSIEFRTGERTHFEQVVQQKYINDTVNINVLRQGKRIRVAVRLTKTLQDGRLVPYEQYDRAPSYYIIGGMVFEPLTKNLLQEWGEQWYYKAPNKMLHYYMYGNVTGERKQVIVLVKVLADEVNVGYHGWGTMVVSRVNGKRVGSMRELIGVCESSKDAYVVIEDDMGYKIVLSRDKVLNRSALILKRYQISHDRSADLR